MKEFIDFIKWAYDPYLKVMGVLIGLGIIGFIFGGCKATETQSHVTYTKTTDSLQVLRTDSIFVKDSVSTTIYAVGDTVFKVVEFHHYGTKWRDRLTYRLRTDTLLRSDTVRVAAPSERTLTKAERRFITIGKWACGIGTAAVIILLASAIWWYRRKI